MSLVDELLRMGSRVRDAILNRYSDPTSRLSVTTPSSLGYDRLPNPDPVIQEHGSMEGLKLYSRMRRQIPFVGGFCKIRIRAIENLEHNWIAGDEEDGESRLWRDRVDAAWADIPDRRAAFSRVMLAPFDGIALAQYIWSTYGATVKNDAGAFDAETIVAPMRIIDLDPWLFEFNREGQLVIQGTQTVLPDLQMLVARSGSADYYGHGEMSDVYNDVWLYDQIQGMGLEVLEKQGLPMALVIYPESWQRDRDRMSGISRSIKTTYKNAMMVPMGDRFEVTFPSQSVAPTFVGSDQTDRLRMLQGSISISLLGAEFAKQETGSLARDQVQNQMRTDLFATDAAVYDAAADDWREKVIRVNAPNLARPLWPYHKTDTGGGLNLLEWMERLKAAQEVGFVVSTDQIAEVQGFEMGVAEDDTRLNGAHVTSALEALTLVGDGTLSRDAGVELLIMLGAIREQSELMVDAQLKDGIKPKQVPPPSPFGTQQPKDLAPGDKLVELPNQDETDDSVTMMSETTGETFRFPTRERARRYFDWI